VTAMRRVLGLLGLLALVALLAPAGGCSFLTLDEFPCPPGGTTLTYENFGAPFLARWCDSCHSAPNGNRDGAPDDFDFATLADVHADAARIFVRAAATNDSMPPGPDEIPPSQREDLAVWLACGAP